MAVTAPSPLAGIEHLAPRERLIAVAARLFAARGYHAIGMAELGDTLGFSRGAIYHHVAGKEDLLDEICSRYMSELGAGARAIAEATPGPAERLQRLGSHLVGVIFQRQAELTVCFRELEALTGERRRKVLDLHSAYEQVWRATLVEGAEAGLFKPYTHFRLKAFLGMFYYSYLWVRPERAETQEEIAATFNEIVADHLLVKPAKGRRARR